MSLFRVELSFAVAVFALMPVHAYGDLLVDSGLTGVSDPQAGFTEFLVTDGAASAMTPLSGGVTMTVTNVNAQYIGARHRAAPVDGGSLTTSALYRDLIFAFDKSGQSGEPPLGTPRGFDVDLSGLLPNTEYRLTVWSWDVSTGSDNRASEWTLTGATSDSLQYAFDGFITPTADGDNQFQLVAQSTAAGALTLAGRRLDTSVNANGEYDHGVFLNALRVEVIPEPTSAALALLAASGVMLRRRRVS